MHLANRVHELGALPSTRYDFGEDLVCTENLIRVDDVMESPKLAE
jgi:hypothetical protein